VPKDSFPDVEIVEMAERHLDEVLQIENRSFAAPWSRRLFRETIAFPLSLSLVIRKKVDKKVVGYANFYVIAGEVQILNVAVAPEERGQGYGRLLLGRSIDVLRSRGAREFFLEVREGNAHAIRLYRKLGFRKVGRRKKYYTETNEDALVMCMKTDRWTGSTT
jgi:ribosomal-protein-alanine N-acetyltransferase